MDAQANSVQHTPCESFNTWAAHPDERIATAAQLLARWCDEANATPYNAQQLAHVLHAESKGVAK